MPLAVGDRLGPYEILAPIGAGGMGEVWKARDTRLDRDVAIKVSAERFSAQFESEAHAIAALNHPHICTLHDVGPNYLVMEYIEGETLADSIKKGPLPLGRALSIAIDVASALDAAHRKGIIHRDLKPGNIMLTDAGAKLLDFGLARIQKHTPEGDETAALTGQAPIVGTLQYMSPEQLEGKEADARSDIFAFGAVLYEMLTGRRAFRGKSTISIITAVTRDEPKPIRELAKNVPPDLERIILRCLRKHPEERYASASDVDRQLKDCSGLTSLSSGISFKMLLRKSVAIPGLLILLLLGSFLGSLLQRSSKVRWARTQALPQIAQLIEQEKFADAYGIAVQAEKYIPDDPILRKFWPLMSGTVSIRTTPPGVSVFRGSYGALAGSSWEFVGRTPLENLRVPRQASRWKFENKGFATAERSTTVQFGRVFPLGLMSVTMDEEAQAPSGMVRVSLGDRPAELLGIPGFEDLPTVPLEDYWLDRYEVTNKQFKEFIDGGGYQKQEYWKHEFRKNGRTLSWTQAMELFRDVTGRTGPATWELGDYPRGQDDFPVSGVSWYEAAAYAEFAGKTLPTIYHWTGAAGTYASAAIVPASNFGGKGPTRVGSNRGMGPYGTYDMAGNVKEWCWNEAGPGKRYIMGGAWDEPAYMFNDADARSPFDRFPNFGFRCAKYNPTRPVANAAAISIVSRARDFQHEKPVSDELFRIYKSMYAYDKTPLNAAVESVEDSEDWKKEKLTFAAAYGNERVIAYLFLPKRAKPPFQTVMFFPGSNVIQLRSSATLEVRAFDFVLKSGRAVMFPVYKGTFERGDDLTSDYPNTTRHWRDHVIAWSRDLGRSIDYLETRPEIDREKLAYMGVSWGGAQAAVLPAVENRLKVCVLVVPGFNLQRSLPEVDQLNFAPRVKVPVLMLNGRFDFFYPVETSQEPMYRLLGASKDQKRRVVYETGHNIPRFELIKETVDWLDRYLGPVK